MDKFIQIQNKIEHLQYLGKDDSLTENGQELLNQLQRIKKEHSEMLEMLQYLSEILGTSFEREKQEINQLIKQATEL